MTGVVAVIVTYQPELEALQLLVASITSQVDSVVIVDNGSYVDISDWGHKHQEGDLEILLLHSNRGIAAAHNVGIQWARERKADFVLLMDQDSVPAPNMVEELLSSFSGQLAPSSVGPRYMDERQDNPPPFIRVRGLALERCACTTQNSILPVDYLISSGCLIPMSVLDEIGGMREDLFIDYVDIEWGLRAQYHGFKNYGVCSAYMRHSLGDKPLKFFGKNIPLHSPLRHYYHFRNAMLLYKEPWIPLNWKLVDGWRLCVKYVFYSLFARPRVAHWSMMTLGVWHGMLGKAGKYESSSL